MKKLLLLAVLLPGCTTLSNIATMNRVLPQVQQLVFLQDAENQDPQGGVYYEVCGKAPDRDEIIRIARLMGWTDTTKFSPNCHNITYKKK